MKSEELNGGPRNPSGNEYASRDLSQNQSGIILDIPELQTSVCQCGHGRESHNRTVVIEDREYQTACEFCPTCNKYLLKSMMEAMRGYRHEEGNGKTRKEILEPSIGTPDEWQEGLKEKHPARRYTQTQNEYVESKIITILDSGRQNETVAIKEGSA